MVDGVRQGLLPEIYPTPDTRAGKMPSGTGIYIYLARYLPDLIVE